MMSPDRVVGECIVTLIDGQLRIDQADPIIHISTELLESTNTRSLVVEGDLVMIGDINPVMYRITERDARAVEAVRVS